MATARGSHRLLTDQVDVHPTSSTIASSPVASSFQRLHLLPPPLLALVASHLEVDSLLRLQRCSSALHRLCADATYMTAAWRWAELWVQDDRLHQWALPWIKCMGDKPTLIPVDVWQAALPAFHAVLVKSAGGDSNRWHARLRELVQQPQRTVWRLFTRGKARDGRSEWQVVDDEEAEQSADVQRVEVLRDITWDQLGEEAVPPYRDVEVRCRLTLRACPYLQHLTFFIDSSTYVEPSHEDTFALVPHLRSLVLGQGREHAGELLLIEEPPVDIERMLDSLPHLTKLRCWHIFLTITDMLDLASHSTLEDLQIDNIDKQLSDLEWIGADMHFPISVEEDVWQLEQDAVSKPLDGGIEGEESEGVESAHDELLIPQVGAQLAGSGSEEGPEWLRKEMPRLRVALTRTQPTQNSCEMRLALADWLHRRLRRGGLHTDEHDQPAWLLRHYRRQVAEVRCVLRAQLSELAATATAAATATSLPAGAEGKRDTAWMKQLDERRRALEDAEHHEACLRESKRRLTKSKTRRCKVQRSIAAREVAGWDAQIAAQRRTVMALANRVQWLKDRVSATRLEAREQAARTTAVKERADNKY